MRCGRLPFLAALLFDCVFIVVAIRPAAPGEVGSLPPSTEDTDGSDSSAAWRCPEADRTNESRLDFELHFEAAAGFNPYATYTLHRMGDCRSPIANVSVTIFPVLNSTAPQQTKAAVVIGDGLLLHPDLWGRLYVCGASRETGLEAACFCEVSIRALNYDKPLRRWMLEWPLESYNVIPDSVLTTMVSAFESKLQMFSSRKVHKPRNIREMRLSLLRVLEDVDQTYGTFCPTALRLFDQLYLLMFLIFLMLLGALAIRLRRSPKTWSGEAEESAALKVDGPVKLCKIWCLEVIAFLGFILTLQGVGVRFINDLRFVPYMIGITMAVGLLEICRMFQCFCQAQLVQAALSRGLYIEWTCSSFTSNAFTSLVDDVGAVLAAVMVCVMILLCAAFHGYAEGMLYAAGMAIWPAAMGIAKSIAFVQEKDAALQQSLVPASIPGLFNVLREDEDKAESFRASLDKALCSEKLRAMDMGTFLSCCRQSKNFLLPADSLDAPGTGQDPESRPCFRVFRDMPWHGRVVFRLSGSRVAWLNPLIFFMLLAMVAGISMARFSITMCTPPALGYLQPVEGMLAPNFTATRLRYAWLRQLHDDEAAMLYESLASVNLTLPPAPADGRVWNQIAKSQETTWRVESNQFGPVAKTYSIEELPARMVPTTLWIRYRNYEQCLWFSMLKLPDVGFSAISVPNSTHYDEASSMLEVAISFREVTLSVPATISDKPERVNESSREAFTTVCRPRTIDYCERSCFLDPRCLLSHRVGDRCCFVWTNVRDTTACLKESQDAQLADRLVAMSRGRGDAERRVQGKAKLHFRHGADEAEHPKKQKQDSAESSSLKFKFDIKTKTLEGHELELYHLGEQGGPMVYTYLKFSLGTPKIQDAIVVVDSDKEEGDVVADTVPDANALQFRLRPNSSLFKLTEAAQTWRKVHVIPLAPDRSITYDLKCPKMQCHMGECDKAPALESCPGLAHPERYSNTFQKRCYDTELARWYDICGGPFPAQAMTMEVNLFKTSTLENFILEPAKTRFRKTHHSVTVYSNFEAKLLNGLCQVPVAGDPNHPVLEVDLACAILGSACTHVGLSFNTAALARNLTSIADFKDFFQGDASAMAKFALCAADSRFPRGSIELSKLPDLDILQLAKVEKVSSKETTMSLSGSLLAANVFRRQLENDATSAGSVLLDILKEGSEKMLQIVVDGLLKQKGSAFAADGRNGARLFDKLVSMLELGETVSSKKLFAALRRYGDGQPMRKVNQFDFHELCNSVVQAYLQNGAGHVFANALRDLSGARLRTDTKLLFAPTSINLPWQSVSDMKDRLPKVLESLVNATGLEYLRLDQVKMKSPNATVQLQSLLTQLPPGILRLGLLNADLYSDRHQERNAIYTILDAVRNHSQIQSVELHHLTPPHHLSLRKDRMEASENISQLLSLSMDHPTLNHTIAISSYAKSLQVWWQAARLRLLDISGLTVGPLQKQSPIARRLVKFDQKQLTLQEMFFSCTALIDVGVNQEPHKCNCNEEVLILLLQRAPQLRHLSYSLDVDPLIEDTLLEVFAPDDPGDPFSGASEEDLHEEVRLSRDCPACRSEGGIQKQAEAIFTHGHLSNVSLGGYGYQLVQHVKKPSNVIALQVQLRFPDGPNSTEATKLLQHVAEHFPNLKFLTLVDSGLNQSICAAAPSLSDRCVVQS